MNWTRVWHLDFNIEKCKIMRIGHKHQADHKLNGVKLEEVEEERDLGITLANSLKPSSRCAKAAAKAMQVLGLIKRNFVINDEDDFRLLFNGFVCPHLEYCMSVCSPYLRKDIECLENVQRMASKMVKGMKHKLYEERLKLLGITSLEKRRVSGNLIQVSQIVKGFDSLNTDNFFELDNGGDHALRGHKWKLKVMICRLQLRKYFFSQMVISSWNKLPEHVVDAYSVNSFKKQLDDCLEGVDISATICFYPESYKLQVKRPGLK